MILYKEIYDMSIGLFDDPFIVEKYREDPVAFYKTMYVYLKNTIFQFNTPTQVISRLSNRTEPIGKKESFESNGVTQTFELSTEPLDNSDYTFYINDVKVEGIYNRENNTVTFLRPIENDEIPSFEWYFAGSFNDDFYNIVSENMYGFLIDNVKGILSHLLVKGWAFNKTNFLLDIERILNDTDFKLYAESTNLNSKLKWFNGIKASINSLQNQLAWTLRFSKNSLNQRW